MSELLKPEDLPRFATAATAEVEEPSEAKKDTGWVAEKPPHEYMNWLHKIAYDNLAFLTQEAINKGRAKYDPKLAQILKIPFNTGARVTRNYIASTTYPGLSGGLFLAGEWVVMPVVVSGQLRLYKIIKHSLASDGYVVVAGAAGSGYNCITPDYIFIGTDIGIVKMNRQTLSAMATFAVGFNCYNMISDGIDLWIQTDGNVIKRVSQLDGSVVATISAVGTDFTGQMVHDGYNHILCGVSNGGTDQVNYLNVTTNAMEAYNLPVSSYMASLLTYDGKRLWTSNQTNIEVYDPVEFSIIKTITRGAANISHMVFTGNKMIAPDIISGNCIHQFDIFTFDEEQIDLGTTVGPAQNYSVFDGLNLFVPEYSGGGPYLWQIIKFWPDI